MEAYFNILLGEVIQKITGLELNSDEVTVTIRWLGESNGYYSESVDFIAL